MFLSLVIICRQDHAAALDNRMRSESGTSGDGTSSRFHGNIDNCVAPPGGGNGGGGGGGGGASAGASKSGGSGAPVGGHSSERINRFVDAASRFPPLGIDIPAPSGMESNGMLEKE